MHSPFPGMDPYLEDPHDWPDFHSSLAKENSLAKDIRDVLNETLPSTDFAQVETRKETYLDVHGGGDVGVRVPDTSIETTDNFAGGTAIAVADAAVEPETPFEACIEVIPEVRFAGVYVRDTSRDRDVVTAIEILSPANERPGPDRLAYERKRTRILETSTALVEVDLLRAGRRVFEIAENPLRPCIVSLSFARSDDDRRVGTLDRSGLSDLLPTRTVPLAVGEPMHLLNLQVPFERTYRGGGYRRGLVDYTRPPRVKLSRPLAAVADDWLSRDRNRRHTPQGQTEEAT